MCCLPLSQHVILIESLDKNPINFNEFNSKSRQVPKESSRNFYSNTFLHNFLIFDSGVDHNMFLQPQSFHNKLFITIYVTVAEGMLGKGSREWEKKADVQLPRDDFFYRRDEKTFIVGITQFSEASACDITFHIMNEGVERFECA